MDETGNSCIEKYYKTRFNCVQEDIFIICINENNFIAIGIIRDIEVNNENKDESRVTLQYRILNPIDVTDDFIQEKKFDKFPE